MMSECEMLLLSLVELRPGTTDIGLSRSVVGRPLPAQKFLSVTVLQSHTMFLVMPTTVVELQRLLAGSETPLVLEAVA